MRIDVEQVLVGLGAGELRGSSWLSSPLLGAASSSQATAPRNGGVTNEAVTSARMTAARGMSVRDTSQPIGAATAQQITAEVVAMMAVVSSGSRKSGFGEQRDEIRQRHVAGLVGEGCRPQATTAAARSARSAPPRTPYSTGLESSSRSPRFRPAASGAACEWAMVITTPKTSAAYALLHLAPPDSERRLADPPSSA